MYGIDRCHIDKLLCVIYNMYRIIIVNQKHQIPIHLHSLYNNIILTLLTNQQPELRYYYNMRLCLCIIIQILYQSYYRIKY